MTMVRTDIDSLVKCDYETAGKFASFLKVIKGSNQLITIMHMNIRSLNANLLEFEYFLSTIDKDIDIFILTECWFRSVRNQHLTLVYYNTSAGSEQLNYTKITLNFMM